MKTRALISVLLLALMALALSGCRRNLVSAAPPPSVVTPQPIEPPPLPEVEVPLPLAAVAAAPVFVPLTEPPLPPPALPAPPPPPRPVAAAAPAPQPDPEPPVISPVLTPTALANAQRRTLEDIRVAERNLQLAYGRQLNAAQSDLVEKVRAFLAQAHEAMRAGDWVRARNLAEKAQVLSVELTKSL